MKYLKNFQENSEYQLYITGEPFLPNISYVENDNQVYYNPDPFNGHEYVDLGLPSGTKWATMNVGATSETEYGNYYMYGMGDKIYDSSDTPYTGMEDPLDLSKDTARQVLGGEWHMPTKTQLKELVANTTYTWATNYKGSGINGGTFTALNGEVLFLPAVNSYNYLWSSTPSSVSSAYYMYYYSSGTRISDNDSRSRGFSVRGVIG